jgi:hypothetical protein
MRLLLLLAATAALTPNRAQVAAVVCYEICWRFGRAAWRRRERGRCTHQWTRAKATLVLLSAAVLW